MTNEEKAIVYDNLIRESDYLQRENSKIKSQHVGNIPPNLQEEIKKNDARIALLVGRLESLFK
jgi:hypothetical protein